METVQRKVCTAIHKNRFSEALRLITNSAQAIRDTLIYEQAYCAYRLNHFDQCLELIKKLGSSSDVKILELQAQAFFRQKRYQEAYDTYMLMSNSNAGSEYSEQRESNLAAVVVSAQLECPDQLVTGAGRFSKLPSVAEIIESIDILSLDDWFGGKYGKRPAAGRKGQTILGRAPGTSKSTPGSKQRTPLANVTGTNLDDLDTITSKPVKARKGRKKRKTRLPQHLDPAGPDPERWLPKWQRSSYNARRKDRQQRGKQAETAALRGTQGAVSEAEAVPLAKTNKAAAPVAGASQGPRQMRPVAQKKKKKTGRR